MKFDNNHILTSIPERERANEQKRQLVPTESRDVKSFSFISNESLSLCEGMPLSVDELCMQLSGTASRMTSAIPGCTVRLDSRKSECSFDGGERDIV